MLSRNVQEFWPSRSYAALAAPRRERVSRLGVEQREIDRLVVQGIAAARRGHVAEALRLLDRAIRLAPDHVEALIWRGGLSEPAQALSYLERACAIAPDNERALAGLAWAEQSLQPPESDATLAEAAGPGDASPPPAMPDKPLSERLPARLKTFVAVAVLALAILCSLSMTQIGWSDDVPTATAEQDSLALVAADAAPPAAEPAAPVAVAAAPTPSPSPTIAPTPTRSPSELDLAWSAEDWPRVIALVEVMRAASPSDGDLREKLFAAHFNHAHQLVRQERLEDALAAFDRALGVNAGDERAVRERKLAQLYVQGTTALSAGSFAEAAGSLRSVFDSRADYLSVKSKLYQAYVGQAAALEKSGQSTDAYQSFQKAAKLDAQGAEAQAGLARLKPAAPTATPAPSAAGKKIEVSIAQQRMTVWQNDKVVWVFKVSTGKTPYLTRKGTFYTRNKIPNAYSTAMGWGMPWWMGIYQVGNYENGIHAMARLRNGTVLPNSMLGRPQTRGCIMLSDKDAKTLYDWTVVGTMVWIH